MGTVLRRPLPMLCNNSGASGGALLGSGLQFSVGSSSVTMGVAVGVKSVIAESGSPVEAARQRLESMIHRALQLEGCNSFTH